MPRTNASERSFILTDDFLTTLNVRLTDSSWSSGIANPQPQTLANFHWYSYQVTTSLDVRPIFDTAEEVAMVIDNASTSASINIFANNTSTNSFVLAAGSRAYMRWDTNEQKWSYHIVTMSTMTIL